MIVVRMSEDQVNGLPHTPAAEHPRQAPGGPGTVARVDQSGVPARHPQQQSVPLANVHGFQAEGAGPPPRPSAGQQAQGEQHQARRQGSAAG